MLLGLMNKPKKFMWMIKSNFMLNKREVFLDSIFIYNNMVEVLFELLKKVIAHLYKHTFYYKL